LVAGLGLADVLWQFRLLLDFSRFDFDNARGHVHVQAILLVVGIQVLDQTAIPFAEGMCSKQEYIVLLLIDKLMLAENSLQLVPEHNEIIV